MKEALLLVAQGTRGIPALMEEKCTNMKYEKLCVLNELSEEM